MKGRFTDARCLATACAFRVAAAARADNANRLAVFANVNRHLMTAIFAPAAVHVVVATARHSRFAYARGLAVGRTRCGPLANHRFAYLGSIGSRRVLRRCLQVAAFDIERAAPGRRGTCGFVAT